jgi:hypothetical protein
MTTDEMSQDQLARMRPMPLAKRAPDAVAAA